MRGLAFMSLLSVSALAQAPSPSDLHRVQIGSKAPDFELATVSGEKFSLGDERGKNIVLIFYRGHW